MAVSGANLHNVFMLLTLEPQLARNPYLVLHVRRNHLVSDTLRELTSYSDVDLKKPLKVRWNHLQVTDLLEGSPSAFLTMLVSSFTQVIFDGEEAVDAGGVTKEFFLLLLKELMDPIYGMFTFHNESNLLWFSDKVSCRVIWLIIHFNITVLLTNGEPGMMPLEFCARLKTASLGSSEGLHNTNRCHGSAVRLQSVQSQCLCVRVDQ